MGTLQDQLKKAGLANAKQAAKAKRAQTLKHKQNQKGILVEDEATRQARETQAAKVLRDKELNAEQQATRIAREVQAQIVELVDLNRIEGRGEVAFAFTDQGAVRTLHLQADDRAAVVAGRLAVVRLDAVGGSRYEVVPRPVAKKVAERDAARVALMNDRHTQDVVDDEYAGYEVPDDLMW